MALTCPLGFYFDDRTEECRNCDYVCGDEYGGRNRLECTEICPGYGVSTTSAPANGNDTDWVMWIVVACAGLAFLIIALVIVLLSYRSKKPRCLWEPKPIVQEETPEGVNGKSASTLQAPLLINRQV